MLKQAERRATGYGLIAFMTLIVTLVVIEPVSKDAGQFGPMVDQIRYAIGLILLSVGGVSAAVSLWFIGRYIYYFKWPERFQDDQQV